VLRGPCHQCVHDSAVVPGIRGLSTLHGIPVLPPRHASCCNPVERFVTYLCDRANEALRRQHVLCGAAVKGKVGPPFLSARPRAPFRRDASQQPCGTARAWRLRAPRQSVGGEGQLFPAHGRGGHAGDEALSETARRWSNSAHTLFTSASTEADRVRLAPVLESP
jgi:hypothetical protein